MWRPGDIPLASSESKPKLIGFVQEEGFRYHEKFDVYGTDRTRVEIWFPETAKRSGNFYSSFDSTPSQTVIEMVYTSEAKRLGTEYFSTADLPLLDAWDVFSGVIDQDTEVYDDISTYKEKAQSGSELNVPNDNGVLFSMLQKDSRKLNERIDEFPVTKFGLLTVGFSRLVLGNTDCFLGSTIARAEDIMESVEARLENIQGPAWGFCKNLGSRLREAHDQDILYEDDFEMFMGIFKDRDEKTYNTIMEGFEG